MSEIPRKVLDRAVEAAERAIGANTIDFDLDEPVIAHAVHDEAVESVEVVAPILFAAGFEEGIKKAREVVPDHVAPGQRECLLAALDSGLSDSQKQVECTCSGTDMCLRCNPDPPVEDGASAPAVTTDVEENTNPEGDENLD